MRACIHVAVFDELNLKSIVYVYVCLCYQSIYFQVAHFTVESQHLKDVEYS